MSRAMMADDKENIRPLAGKGMGARKMRKGFSALLDSAVKEHKEEVDEKVAIRSQCKDITNMVNKLCSDFDREDRGKTGYIRDSMVVIYAHIDLRLAKDIDECERSMAKEFEKMKRDEEKYNESSALQLAIEERKSFALRAQAKRDLEAKDAEIARTSVLDDIESDYKLAKACEGDEEFALRVKKEIEDELYAAELEELERQEYEKMKSSQQDLIDQDFELARQEQDRVTRELEEERNLMRAKDFEVAREVQCNITTHYISDKENQEREDRRLAMKLVTKSARQAHEDQKKTKVLDTADLCSISAIAAQWEDATADIQNVSGGLCITLLLPHLKDLRVTMKRNHIVDIEAKRVILSGDKTATKHNSAYSAEFEIKGRKLNLSDRDMNYNYCSESGLLHIYVDNIHLDDDDDEADSKEEKADGPKRSYRGNALAAIRQSFSRIFNK